MDRWRGRVALVTGASVGIGAAICKVLVQSGMKVVGAARGVEKIKDLSKGLEGESGSLLAVKCDLTKDEDIYSLFKIIKEEYGLGVDICINNAGLSSNTSLLDGSSEEWRTMMNINVIALCLCTKLAVASMRERGVDDGHIINISSLAGHAVVPKPKIHFYTGTKFAVRALTEGLRQELRQIKSQIRVSSISPGVVETEFAQRMNKDEGESAKALYSSLKKPIQADDVAATLLHIISSPPHLEINDVLMRPTDQGL